MPGLSYDYGEGLAEPYQYRKRGHQGKSVFSQMSPEYDDDVSVLE